MALQNQMVGGFILFCHTTSPVFDRSDQFPFSVRLFGSFAPELPPSHIQAGLTHMKQTYCPPGREANLYTWVQQNQAFKLHSHALRAKLCFCGHPSPLNYPQIFSARSSCLAQGFCFLLMRRAGWEEPLPPREKAESFDLIQQARMGYPVSAWAGGVVPTPEHTASLHVP